MSLDDFIKKYGEESGTKRYYGLQKCLASRAATYKKHPFKRLTKDWFIWRYPVNGLERFEEHARKSAHTLENFIAIYGEEKDPENYKKTVAKKNTVQRIKELHGKNAEKIIKEKYLRAAESNKRKLRSMTESEYKQFIQSRTQKSSQTKTEKYGGRSKLSLYVEKYGNAGPRKYAEFLQSTFKSIGSSREAEKLLLSILEKNSWLQNYTLYYRNANDNSKKEWFISDTSGVCFYDFCVKEAKTILEYDGAKWHPTKEQAESLGDKIMEITNLSFREKYLIDENKKQKAQQHGFFVFTVRSDFTEEQKQSIIGAFLEKTKENLLKGQGNGKIL